MKLKQFVLLLTLLIFVSCSTVKVLETEAEEGFSLNQYSAFAFYKDDDRVMDRSRSFDEGMEIIREEIAAQLIIRGLRESEEADLLVNIGLVVREDEQTRETNIMEAPSYIGQRRYSWKSEEVVTHTYQVGTVTLHLVDKIENKLVWRGVAEGIIPEKGKNLRSTINTGVDKLFSEIP